LSIIRRSSTLAKHEREAGEGGQTKIVETNLYFDFRLSAFAFKKDELRRMNELTIVDVIPAASRPLQGAERQALGLVSRASALQVSTTICSAAPARDHNHLLGSSSRIRGGNPRHPSCPPGQHL